MKNNRDIGREGLNEESTPSYVAAFNSILSRWL
jgi:hypothetical protein